MDPPRVEATRIMYYLGPPVVPFHPFLGEGSPTKIDYAKKGALVLTTLQDRRNSMQCKHFLKLRANNCFDIREIDVHCNNWAHGFTEHARRGWTGLGCAIVLAAESILCKEVPSHQLTWSLTRGLFKRNMYSRTPCQVPC